MASRGNGMEGKVIACRYCGHSGTGQGPSPIFKVALVGTWVLVAVMVGAVALLGPTLVAVSPILMGSAIGMLSPLYAKLAEPLKCRSCGDVLLPEQPEPHDVVAHGASEGLSENTEGAVAAH